MYYGFDRVEWINFDNNLRRCYDKIFYCFDRVFCGNFCYICIYNFLVYLYRWCYLDKDCFGIY